MADREARHRLCLQTLGNNICQKEFAEAFGRSLIVQGDRWFDHFVKIDALFPAPAGQKQRGPLRPFQLCNALKVCKQALAGVVAFDIFDMEIGT